MKVRILRQRGPMGEPYWEGFDYDGPADFSVAGVLDYLNYHDDMVNDQGQPTGRIGWECSCLQGLCGACAMVINGVPALACETFLRDLKLKRDTLTIEPLRKFPTVSDLIVDRSVMRDQLRDTGMFIGEYSAGGDGDHAHQYAAAKCLKCGLCLEVCPNYVSGRTFFGAAFANDCYLVAARNPAKAKEIGAHYAAHFGSACSKSLSCAAVCPMQIPTLASIAKMNRK